MGPFTKKIPFERMSEGHFPKREILIEATHIHGCHSVLISVLRFGSVALVQHADYGARGGHKDDVRHHVDNALVHRENVPAITGETTQLATMVLTLVQLTAS